MKKILATLFALFCTPAAAQNYLSDDGTFRSVVQGTTNGQLLINSGGFLAGASGSVAFTFLQNGTGAVSTTMDYLLRANVIMPEMFKAVTCNGTNDGPAIQAAINYAAIIKGRVQLKNCSYTVSTPIVDSSGIDVTGSGFTGVQGAGFNNGTRIVFQPASGGLIAYRVRDAGNIISGGSLSNINFFAPGTSFSSTAIEVEDVSHYRISNVFINGGEIVPTIGAFWLGTGIRTRGREFVYIDHNYIVADQPINISDNPNSTIDIDVSSFSDLSLTANAQPGIKIDSGVNYSRLNLSDIHCAVGTYCLYNNDTTATGPSIGLTIRNVAHEQSTDTSSYNIYINRPVAGPLDTLVLDGYNLWDNFTHGIYLRNVHDVRLGGVFYQGVGKSCMNVDGTVTGLSWASSRWQCDATNFTGQTLIWQDPSAGAGYGFSRNAQYCSSSETSCAGRAGLGTSDILNSGNITSGTFNNVALTTPAFTATLTLGSGKTLAFSNTMTQTANDGSTIAFGTGGTVLYTSSGAALTKTDDTNVTLTLGGSPTIALVNAASITAGWTGTLAASRGGTGISSLGTGVATALGINVGSAGAFVALNGAGGTPSGITLTNGTGLPTTGLTGTLQAAQVPAFTGGDVTSSAGSLVLTIAANAVTNAKLATMATNTVKVNATSGTAVPTDQSMPTCATSASALQWNINSGFQCNLAINAATLGSTTFVSPGPIGTGTPGLAIFTSVTSPLYYGGASAGSTALLNGTSNGSPVSAFINLQSNGQFTSIGNTTPKTYLDVNENLTTSNALVIATSLTRFQAANTTNSGLEIVSYGAAQGNIVAGAAAGGTAASPTATASGGQLYNMRGYGWQPSGGSWQIGGIWIMRAENTWSATDQSVSHDWYTTPKATTALALAMTLNASGGLGVGTATDPGIGKVSALNGFVANGLSGITTVCTVAVGNVLTFTLGILTAKGGVAGCT